MVEKKEKAAEKKTEAKKPAAKHAAAPKAAAPKAEQKAAKAPAAKPAGKKPAAAKPAYSGAKLKVIQTGSPIGRQKNQRATLIGLGLNKINRTRELPDTADVRGMINTVKHLVKIVG